MRSIAPQHYCSPPVHLDKNLRTCSHVLVRVDTPKGALNPRYPETHKVLQRLDKYFTLAMNGRLLNVSTDHLKVAYVLSSAMENEQRPSTSADMIDVIYKDIVFADENQSNSVTGRNSVNRKLNRPDIIYHYNDLLRKPKQTRYVRLIQTSNRYLDWNEQGCAYYTFYRLFPDTHWGRFFDTTLHCMLPQYSSLRICCAIIAPMSSALTSSHTYM